MENFPIIDDHLARKHETVRRWQLEETIKLAINWMVGWGGGYFYYLMLKIGILIHAKTNCSPIHVPTASYYQIATLPSCMIKSVWQHQTRQLAKSDHTGIATQY